MTSIEKLNQLVNCAVTGTDPGPLTPDEAESFARVLYDCRRRHTGGAHSSRRQRAILPRMVPPCRVAGGCRR